MNLTGYIMENHHVELVDPETIIGIESIPEQIVEFPGDTVCFIHKIQ